MPDLIETTAMNTTAGALADRLERLNDEIVAFVESCSPARWAATTVEEGWPVPAAAMHIATAHMIIPHWVHRVSAGLRVTETLDDFVILNAADARKYAGASRAEVAGQLRVNGAAAVGFLRGLTDAELRGVGWFGPAGAELSAAALAERALVGHPAEHFASIRAAHPAAHWSGSGGTS